MSVRIRLLTGRVVFVIGAIGAAAAACLVKTEATSERLCTPGNYVFCRCQDRTEGTKLCRPDGRSFDSCTQCLGGVDDPASSAPGGDPVGDNTGSSSDVDSSGMEDVFVPPISDDAGRLDAGSTICSGKPNGSPCAAGSGPCRMLVCSGGHCTGDVARPDGFDWSPGDDTAHCCGGQQVHTDTTTNCGVCGATCTGAQTCQPLGGGWFCRGCQLSNECWTGCCSLKIDGGSCASSDCTTGACKQSVCPANATCIVGGDASSNYCKY